MKYIILTIFLSSIIFIGLLFQHQKTVETNSSSANRLSITTSFYPLWYFTSEIGGEYVSVNSVTPSGVEPHDYEPTTTDIAHMEQSELIIVNGGGVEPWLERLQPEFKQNDVLVVVTGEGLLTNEMLEEGKNTVDPHIWLDPVLANKQVKRIIEGLQTVDPIHKDYYETRGNALSEKLSQLDQNFRQELTRCRQQTVITSHAALGYLADRYGFKQESIAGLSPDEEPSPKQLGVLANKAKSEQIRYILFETTISSRLAETLAQEVGASTLVFNTLEGVSAEEQQEGKNYFTLQEQNKSVLSTALECHEGQ